MNNAGNARVNRHPSCEIYPKRYFDSSPTWFAWIKLTAADVYSLHRERGFEGQQIFFHLNYPIRYVDFVGVVASIELVAGKYTVVQLDDSSGILIEAKIALNLTGQEGHVVPLSSRTSNVEVANLRIVISMGVASIFVGDHALEVGELLRVKGELDEFRGMRQIIPRRVWHLTETMEEVRFWSKMNSFKREVLTKPWVLDEGERQKIDALVLRNEAVALKKQKKLERLQAKQMTKDRMDMIQSAARTLSTGPPDIDVQRWAKRKEKKKRHEAYLNDKQLELAANMDNGALEGSHIIRKPWD